MVNSADSIISASTLAICWGVASRFRQKNKLRTLNPEMCVTLDFTAPNASTEPAQSDFPYGLLEFCTEDTRLITVRRTGPIE